MNIDVICLNCFTIQSESVKADDKIAWSCRSCFTVHETNTQTCETVKHLLAIDENGNEVKAPRQIYGGIGYHGRFRE